MRVVQSLEREIFRPLFSLHLSLTKVSRLLLIFLRPVLYLFLVVKFITEGCGDNVSVTIDGLKGELGVDSTNKNGSAVIISCRTHKLYNLTMTVVVQ